MPTTTTSSSRARGDAVPLSPGTSSATGTSNFAKVSLAHHGDEAANTRLVLGHVLDALLRMLHPFTPYVTEQLWTSLTDGESIVIAA